MTKIIILGLIIFGLAGCQLPDSSKWIQSRRCTIKGNVNAEGRRVYQTKDCSKYNEVNIKISKGDRWFCSEEDAVAAGFVKSKNCPIGE